MPPTHEQAQVIGHDRTDHARVVAGPGSGKSWTAIALLERLHETAPSDPLGLLTFTRAATGELAKKVAAAGVPWLDPSTIHAFALRLLVTHPGLVSIPYPLRIPDSWETETLVHPALARRLRTRGFATVRTTTISQLEREMAARWEALDDTLVLLADLAPALRNAYVGEWRQHRERFSYLLLAELPSRAGDLIEDFGVDLGKARFLVVDEYQDLNKADIRLLALVAAKGVRLLAIGDDDQSIYGFRMAAPEGLIRFHDQFPQARDYQLSVSLRCARAPLDAALALIETSPGRPPRRRLRPLPDAPEGNYQYLRFPNQTAEARGVAALIAARVRAGVARKDIVILVRSNVSVWADLMAPELQARGITLVDTEWVVRSLADGNLRRALAIARIALDSADSLAWLSLLVLTSGISQDFVDYVEASLQDEERFGQGLLRLSPRFDGAPAPNSAKAARILIAEVVSVAATVDPKTLPDDDAGWGGWLLRKVPHRALSTEAESLVLTVGRLVDPKDGLGNFLGQLEPVGKDYATQAEAVRIMTMSASKGLTVDSAYLMGVEAGILPHPRASVDEERRLLYVAMTRSTHTTILTAATRRTGPTARHGAPNINQPRGRCPLLADLPMGQWHDGPQYVAATTGAA